MDTHENLDADDIVNVCIFWDFSAKSGIARMLCTTAT